jgi:hypothetical protein
MHGEVAEWSMALAWKAGMLQKGIEGSNPSFSATNPANGWIVMINKTENPIYTL